MKSEITFLVNPSNSLIGDITVPGDKSISHRAIMFGALADGVTHIHGFLEGEDSLHTLAAFRAMGVDIDHQSGGEVLVNGVGMRGLQRPSEPLFVGNSGTSMRLLAGILSAQSFKSQLSGDESLCKRPMRRITEPLKNMGADIQTNDQGCPPLNISPVTKLSGITYEMPVASAQIKSCLLLAGLYAEGKTCIREPGVSRDHTEHMLQSFAYPIETEQQCVCLQGGGKLKAAEINIPADISSAAFFIVGASIAQGSELLLRNIGINSSRLGVITIMRAMGANIELLNQTCYGSEPVADIRVRSSDLRGIEIPPSLVPLAIDEFPAIFIAAACARGTTVLSNAKELRVKETDRIKAMEVGLLNLGIDAQATEDGMVINGSDEKAVFGGGKIDSFGDHRIAMAFSMAALRASHGITIVNCKNVDTSFPGFPELASSVGLNIAV